MATTKQLAARIDDVEGALTDERGIREQQMAEFDEEMEHLYAECRRIVRRIAKIDQRVKALARK